MSDCAECDEPCPPWHGPFGRGRERTYCTIRCGVRARQRRWARAHPREPSTPNPCGICGLASRPKSLYCSIACSGIGNRQQRLRLRAEKLGRDETDLEEEVRAKRLEADEILASVAAES